MQKRRSLVAAAVIGLAAGAVSTPPAVADVSHSTHAVDSAATVQLCHGKPATIVGTPRKERIIGTGQRDVIVALDGNDRIFGKGGNDWICGRGGNDRIYPGGGSDHVEGGQDNDVVRYSTGDDIIDGGGSPDTLDYAHAPAAVRIDGRQRTAAFGRSERDHYQGFENYGLTKFDDTFRAGGAGANVYADDGDDDLVGGHSQDSFNGGPGDDRLDGGLGDDGLTGGLGVDRMVDLHGRSYVSDGAPKRRDRGGVIRTGPGKDLLFIYPGRRSIDTGSGDDNLVLRGGLAGSTIWTGSGDDVVLSRDPYRSGPMTLRLQDGDDTFGCTGVACGGDSLIYGGPGTNKLDLWEAIPAVTAVLGPFGSLVIHGGDGDRSLSLFDFVDITTGGGDDTITGSDDDNEFLTRDGDDTINALGGDDLIVAESGADTADGGGGNDQCYGVESPTNCETVG